MSFRCLPVICALAFGAAAQAGHTVRRTDRITSVKFLRGQLMGQGTLGLEGQDLPDLRLGSGFRSSRRSATDRV